MLIIQQKNRRNMTWYMNFCAPFMPNDSTINFHRYFQASLLTLYSIAYLVIHTYYLYWGPLPLSQRADQSNSHSSDLESSLKAKNRADLDSDNSSSLSQNKEVSIKLEQQVNQSCVELKKTTQSTWNNSNSSGGDKGEDIIENVTIAEIEQYHSIVYGHFAVGLGLSIMYTPYAEQTIAALLYVVLTIPLMMANSRRMIYTTRFFWIVMSLILIFFFTSGLLEVGQSNWDVLNLNCFANEYTPLYG